MNKLECATNNAMEWLKNNGMQPNSSKCHMLICGHKYECMIRNIDNSQVIESHMAKLLGIKIDAGLTFNGHMETVCKRASHKLNALSRLCAIIPFHRRKVLMLAFFNSQFSYCPLVWMFCNRNINAKINNLHFRALRMVYQDEPSSFQELLSKDGSVTVHHRNIQSLAIEMFKVTKGVAAVLMEQIFVNNPSAYTEHVSANTRSKSTFYNCVNPKTTKYGLDTLRSFGPKVWDMIPTELKNIKSLPIFKKEIRKWTPANCPCKLCRDFIPHLGYL